MNEAWASLDSGLDLGDDKAWEEVPNGLGDSAGFDATLDQIVTMYWGGMQLELAAAIEAFSNFEEHQPDRHEDESCKSGDLATAQIDGLVDLWNPFGSEEAAKVKEALPDRWAASLSDGAQSGSASRAALKERRARALLQALGFLDLDFVREARRPALRSWGQKPQVDTSGSNGLLAARQCTECRHLIRSFHYFECVSGCRDAAKDLRKMPPQAGAISKELYHDPTLHYHHAGGTRLRDQKPYMLCPACMPSSLHDRGHLRAFRAFTKGGDREAKQFACELDLWEDDLDRRFWRGLGMNALEMLGSNLKNPFYRKTSSRHLFPAGNAHCAVMFGPLLIENGMTR